MLHIELVKAMLVGEPGSSVILTFLHSGSDDDRFFPFLIEYLWRVSMFDVRARVRECVRACVRASERARERLSACLCSRDESENL